LDVSYKSFTAYVQAETGSIHSEQHKLLIKPQSAGSWGTRAQYFTFFYEYLGGWAWGQLMVDGSEFWLLTPDS
jgi:hypothetical protein